MKKLIIIIGILTVASCSKSLPKCTEAGAKDLALSIIRDKVETQIKNCKPNFIYGTDYNFCLPVKFENLKFYFEINRTLEKKDDTNKCEGQLVMLNTNNKKQEKTSINYDIIKSEEDGVAYYISIDGISLLRVSYGLNNLK